MKSILIGVTSALVLLYLPVVSCLEVRYVNSTTTTASASITPPPTYCGGCKLNYEVHASVWWPTVYTDYIATWVYTVDKGSGKTIGSSLKSRPPNATAIEDLDYGVNFTSVYKLRDGGAVQYTYLNTLSNGPFTTIIQYNEITMSAPDWHVGYFYSTLYYNKTLASTVCAVGYTTGTPGDLNLPAVTQYSYTTVVPFTDGYNMSNVITYGVDSLASYVATRLNLTVPACTDNGGGGVGTLKVGVTQLTSVSTFFALAQNTPTPSATPSPQPPSTTPPSPSITSGPPTGPTSSPNPPQLPQSPPSPPADTVVPPPSPTTGPGAEPEPEPTQPNPTTSVNINPPADNEYKTDSTTIVTVIQGTTRAVVVPVDAIEDGQIATTITSVIGGPSGIQTSIRTTEVPVGSFIASMGGINGSPKDTPSTTAATGSGNASSTSPLEFEAEASLPQRSFILTLTATFLLLAAHL